MTSFEYRAHRVPSVHGGMAAHPVSRAGEALDFFRHFTREPPDELTAYFSLFASSGQPAQKLAAITACRCGDDPGIAERDLKPLRKFGPPLADAIRVMPYPVVNTLNDAGYPGEPSATGSPHSSPRWAIRLCRSWWTRSSGARRR